MKSLTLWALFALALVADPVAAAAAPPLKCNNNQVSAIQRINLDDTALKNACGAEAFNEFKANLLKDPAPVAPYKCSNTCITLIKAKSKDASNYYCTINGVRADQIIYNLCKYNAKYTALASTECSTTELPALQDQYYTSLSAVEACGQIAVDNFKAKGYAEDPAMNYPVQCSQTCADYVNAAIISAPQCTYNNVPAIRYLGYLCKWNYITTASTSTSSEPITGAPVTDGVSSYSQEGTPAQTDKSPMVSGDVKTSAPTADNAHALAGASAAVLIVFVGATLAME